jgi:hypothetical protein
LLLTQRLKYSFDSGLVGPNHKIGHLLREGIHVVPTDIIKLDTVIVGGGIAGLSADWWLKKIKKGFYIARNVQRGWWQFKK